MPKKTFLVLVVFIFLFSFYTAKASVVINEVQLSPTEGRFIELYNSDNAEVDLTNWYIQRKTQSGTSFGSLVSNTNFENKKIRANGYFLISRTSVSNSDIVLGSLTLTESNSIQIKNGNGDVVDKICWGDITECDETKVASPTDGQSVQRNQDGILIIGNPTPGAQNYVSSGGSTQTSSNSNFYISSSSSSTTTETTKPKVSEVPKIKTKITASRTLVFIGIPIDFKANTTGYSNEPITYGSYFWNFGDGDSKETKADDTAKLTHIFSYEGEYTVALEYKKNSYTDDVDATDKIVVKVLKNDVSISNIGDEKDFFIEISNNTNYEADLSRWVLSSSIKSFVLPKNMVIGAKKKIILSPKITGFSILDKDTLKLSNSQGELIFDYSNLDKPAEVLAKNTVPMKIITVSESIKSDINTEDESIKNISKNDTKKEVQIADFPINNQQAMALKSLSNTEGSNNAKYGMFGLFAFLGIGTSAAYFIRNRNRKLVSSTNGDDFEILDG